MYSQESWLLATADSIWLLWSFITTLKKILEMEKSLNRNQGVFLLEI